ncbi:MAG: membrane protein insertion efficiency factor YidD [Burkholderiaceae bacterium]|jgi:putative membrane protein insertion efficiency factor|nr:membrane protein insertion efficiency factor YidD [Betaproteobacteria bacterium]
MRSFGFFHGVLIWFAQLVIRGYQLSLRIVLGPRCRFLPTCSDYAHEAIELHGLWKGGRMTIHRLCRCRPGGGSGYDPVSSGQEPPSGS